MSSIVPSLSIKQRVFVIIQLCIAFSLILWYVAQPFMGEYFSVKSRLLLYEYAIGSSTLLQSDQQKETLSRNKMRLAAMKEEDKRRIENDYKKLYDYSTRPMLTKIGNGIMTLLFHVPSFKLAWMIFSTIICIFLLLRKEGSAKVSWILPCIALAYGIDNQINGLPSYVSPEAALFPAEEKVIKDYLKEPLADSTEMQRTQLKNGWERYLISNWSRDSTQSWNDQIEEAEFNFTIARINSLRLLPLQEWKTTFYEKSSMVLIFVYIIWNILFAWHMTRRVIPRKVLLVSN